MNPGRPSPPSDRTDVRRRSAWHGLSSPWSAFTWAGKPRPLPRAGERGFALLITVTLLAFVVILLIGLAAYTRIETAIAGNTQRQAQARENALFALNVAVGQLQKYAGPDQRVTATAEAFGGAANTRRFTGVWTTDATADPDGDPLTPLTWLVSGNEPLNADGTPVNPLAIVPSVQPVAPVQLVGARTAGNGNSSEFISVPLQNIRTAGVPGITPTATPPVIGRYAWWVGDQGVKAPVAVADDSAKIDYPPFVTSTTNAAGVTTTSTDLRERIRQQIGLGAGAADANGAPVFEPRDSFNAPLVTDGRVIATNQIALLRLPSGNGAIGLSRLLPNFHAWSPNNHAVLANTKLGGLRQDLSVDSSLLGSEVQNWLNYSAYMEPPTAGGPSAPAPDYTDPTMRRRNVLQASSPTIAPVLSFFLLTFNVRTVGGSQATLPLEVRARWAMTFWNPYTSALVPENLRVEVTGLPDIRVDDETAGRAGIVAAFPLHAAYGTPLKISLPWNVGAPNGTAGDLASWLPGRVYTWTSLEDISGSPPPPEGYASNFYSHNISGDSKSGVIVPAPGGAIVDGDHVCHIDGEAQSLTVTLFAVRSGGDVQLGTFTSPAFDAFHTTSQKIGDNGYQFSYVFRLAESLDGMPWLTTAGLDHRSGTLGPDAFAYQATVNNPSDPASFENYTKISSPDRLLDRETNESTYDSDTPIFELPRAPLLSIGQFQHLPVAGQRPFAIGNPWIGATQLNGINASELFDRYFFSGVVSGVTPTTTINGSLLLPNPQLKVLRDPTTGAATAAADFQAAPNAQSSKFLLQGAAFNLNSTSAAAWAAVLRSVRFPAPQSFSYLDADFTSGTAGDSAVQIQSSDDAQFFRFPQSAQESYKIDPGYAASTVPPSSSGPDIPSAANTHLFRQGMKTLSAGVVRAVADRIVQYVERKHGASGPDGGPFRSLEEFLAPSVLFVDGNGVSRSLLEAAIADAATSGGESVNGMVAEFSSQWLTQGDIMTALAPVLFPRSDTFLIRAYGEAVNPMTSATEGRAWCEAVVQRLPEYFDPSATTGDAPEVAPAALVNTLNQTYGRRFKVVSFRWLTRSDI